MIVFLPEVVILEIHKEQINLYGGIHGVRDSNILDAAINMPQMQFEGRFLHTTIFHMASAYGFHISEGQPFIDGNKRTAGMSMLTFLAVNGLEPIVSQYKYYDAIMSLANGQISKEDLTNWLYTAVDLSKPVPNGLLDTNYDKE